MEIMAYGRQRSQNRQPESKSLPILLRLWASPLDLLTGSYTLLQLCTVVKGLGWNLRLEGPDFYLVFKLALRQARLCSLCFRMRKRLKFGNRPEDSMIWALGHVLCLDVVVIVWLL